MKNIHKLIFNHFYKLKHDLKRSYIVSPESNDSKKNVRSGLILKIHPIYAMVLSFFSNPITLNDATEKIADFLEISQKETEELIRKLIERDEFTSCEYGGITNVFPPNILINADDAYSTYADNIQYSPMQFVYQDLDFQQERFFTSPVGIVFMINNCCATDCAYCYADKRVKSDSLPLNKIKQIIKNAHDAGVSNILITGGEIFLCKFWKELVDVLLTYHYKPPLFSTKVPLKEADIDAIKVYNIPVQISLDSLVNLELMQILKVQSDYLEKIKQTILLLDQKGVQFQVATILTKYNATIETLATMYDFVKDLKNITRWEIRVAFKSLYSRSNFDDIKISQESESLIENWILIKKKNARINILWSPSGGENRYFKSEGGSHKFIGSKCSANSSHMVILPDGKVTICEQLYWNPRFIIGDVSEQSIEEVWSSHEALSLAFPKKEDFRDKSICKKCSIFETCLAYPNKCYADVLKGYGDENWDYPDPRCNKAPQFIYDLRHH